jgi:hypothetical protein
MSKNSTGEIVVKPLVLMEDCNVPAEVDELVRQARCPVDDVWSR